MHPKSYEKEKARKLIEKTILTQKEIALHLGVTEKTVSKWKKQFKEEKQRKDVAVEIQLRKIHAELTEIKTILKSKLWRT